MTGAEDARRARAEDLALFVVNLGMSPRDYWALTLLEHEAIVQAWNRKNRKN